MVGEEDMGTTLIKNLMTRRHGYDAGKSRTLISAHKQLSEKPKNIYQARILAKLQEETFEALNKSTNTDIALAHVEKEKSSSFIKAWEESEKAKVDNKAQKKLVVVASQENTKKAAIEAKLKKLEKEKKKADYAGKMQNKVALIHKEADEKRAMVEAIKGEEMLEAEEIAAKYRAIGTVPKKLGCFGC